MIFPPHPCLAPQLREPIRSSKWNLHHKN